MRCSAFEYAPLSLPKPPSSHCDHELLARYSVIDVVGSLSRFGTVEGGSVGRLALLPIHAY